MTKMLAEFERMLFEFGRRKYDPNTDSYRNPRSKKLSPIHGPSVRLAAKLAAQDPSHWANYFECALKSKVAGQ